MTRTLIGVLVWTPAFLLLELPAHWRLVPWPTLSSTVWDLIKWWHPIAYFVALAMFVLLGHFEAHWSVKWLLGVTAVSTAFILVHLASRG